MPGGLLLSRFDRRQPLGDDGAPASSSGAAPADTCAPSHEHDEARLVNAAVEHRAAVAAAAAARDPIAAAVAGKSADDDDMDETVDASLVQSLDEVAFDKGLWALINRCQPTERIREFLNRLDSDARRREWASRRCPSGYTSLLYAARQANVETAQLLLSLGANPNDATPTSRMSALHRAAACGNVAMCALLISAGADRAARDAQGLTPRDWVERRLYPSARADPASPEAERTRLELLQMLACPDGATTLP
jgi:hypothetical protein